MPPRFTSVDPRQLVEQVTPGEASQVRSSQRRADRIREFVCAHLPEHIDVEVVITPGISTAAVLPADIDAILGADATDLDRQQAKRLLSGVDADYLVLVTGNEAPLDRVPLNDQLTADHAHQFGLAFHELLHILKTAITTIGLLIGEEIDEQYRQPVHDLINIIEDGAIEREAVSGRHFSDNAGIRLEITRRIHSMTPTDVPDDQQVQYSFWDAVTSTLYDAAIYPTGVTDVLLDPDDDRISFTSDADRQAFETVRDDLEQLVAEALSIRSEDPGKRPQSAGKNASVLRAKRVIETWRTAIQPVLENRSREMQESAGGAEGDSESGDDPQENGARSRQEDPAERFGGHAEPDNGDRSDRPENETGGADPGDGESRPAVPPEPPEASAITVSREATDDPFQDVFEQPSLLPDPALDEVDENENDAMPIGAEGADLPSPQRGVEEGDLGADDSTVAEGDSGRRPSSPTQALAEAIERVREQDGSTRQDSAGDQTEEGQDKSKDPSSNAHQLTFDELDSGETNHGVGDEEYEDSTPTDVDQSAANDVDPDEADGDSPGLESTVSSNMDAGLRGESQPEPIGPAHARSPDRPPGDEQETYEEALETDRQASHDEAAREGVNRDALEREFEELGRVIEREHHQVDDGADESSPGGSSGGPGSLDDLDLVPVSDELVPVGEWDAIEDGAHRVAATLEKELRLERQHGERTGLTAGSYDTRAGHRLVIGDPRVCKSRTPGREKRYALVLILDRSGSMREGTPPKIEVATQALARFAVAAEELGIEVAIVDFVHGRARLVKPFSVETRHVQATLLDRSCGGGTPLADAIGLARRLVELQRDEPLVITVTDDEPRSVEAVIEQLRASSAPVCSLTIATDCRPGTLSPDASRLAPYYERQAAVYSPERLDDRLDQFASLLAGF